MKNYYFYASPIGDLTLVSDENKLIAVRYGKNFFHDELPICDKNLEKNNILNATKNWLRAYFNGGNPDLSELAISPCGNEFRETVWKLLCKISYGSTVTYGYIAQETAKLMGKDKMSAQAVGGAIGSNPIAIIIPCHRVIGKDGNITGYAGGIDKKLFLLKHEGVDMSKIYCKENKILD